MTKPTDGRPTDSLAEWMTEWMNGYKGNKNKEADLVNDEWTGADTSSDRAYLLYQSIHQYSSDYAIVVFSVHT